MTDLVKTLRRSYWIGDNMTTAALAEEAADEIERLRVYETEAELVDEIVRLRGVIAAAESINAEPAWTLEQARQKSDRLSVLLSPGPLRESAES